MKRIRAMRSIFVTVLCLIMLSTTSKAQWQKMNLSGGLTLDMRSFHGGETVMLACVQDDGLYRSGNRAGSWEKAIDDNCYNITVIDNGIAYISGETALYKSSNFGVDWEIILPFRTKAVFAGENGFVAADTSNKEYNSNGYSDPWIISFDYGNNWQIWEGSQAQRPDNQALNYVHDFQCGILFHESGKIFKYDKGCLYRTHVDSISNWSLITNDLSKYNALYLSQSSALSDTLFYFGKSYDFHPMGGIGGGAYYSTNWGIDWTGITSHSTTAIEMLGNNIFIGKESGELIHYNILNKSEILVGTFGGLIISIDLKYLESGEIIVASYGGIFKTTNNGENWHKCDQGIFQNQVTGVQIVPRNDGSERIIAATRYGGLLSSDDGGWTWDITASEAYISPGLLKCAPSNPRYIYAAGEYVYFSTNSGSTWTTIYPNETDIPELIFYGGDSRALDLDVDPLNETKFFLSYNDKSLDIIGNTHNIELVKLISGNWQWTVKHWNDSEYYGVLTNQFDSFHQCIWSTNSNDWGIIPSKIIGVDPLNDSLKYSIDIPSESYSFNWIVIDSTVLYVNCDSARIYRSPDFGKNWQSVSLSLNNTTQYNDRHIYPVPAQFVWHPDENRLYFLHWGSGIYNSNDRGVSWNDYNEGLDELVAYQVAFSQDVPDVTYLAAHDGLYVRGDISDIASKCQPSYQAHQFTLYQNYPNPFNNVTEIRYQVFEKTDLDLSIYSINGSRIQTLSSGIQLPGNYRIQWSSNNLASGIYFIQINSPEYTAVKKCILLK
ncbi:T9SS type A sorting domain-containing protein [bacterium]|nr:T9SS type A sorting domain-containing protein [bacterium]MBU1633704.1 T9SS type A sorting domain-containing protein [bacterium]MBU1875126.1 T9SS type A sorting domain-containing protein [bacterium]